MKKLSLAKDVQIAPITYRLCAIAIDVIFLATISYTTTYLLKTFNYQSAIESFLGTPIDNFMYVLSWPYFVFLESSKFQGSVGKILCNIKVVNYEQEKISFLQGNIRFFVRFVSGLNILISLFTFKSSTTQALHDIMAQDYVVMR